MKSGVLPPQTVFPRQCVWVFPERHVRAGARCTRRPIRGATICPKHGVNEGVRRRAGERVEEETALQFAERQMQALGITDRSPLEHLQETLDLAAYTYQHWRLVCQDLMKGRSTWMGRDRHGQLVLHPYVQAREAALQVWTRVAKYALDAKVADRLAKVREDEADLLMTQNRAVFAWMQQQGYVTAAQAAAGLQNLGQRLNKLGANDIEGQARLKP